MNNYRDGCRLGIKLASMAVATIGALVAVNANGYGVPATSPDAVKLMGMAQHDADNSQGVDGAVTVVVGRNQQYLLPVDADKPLTQADVGKTALLTPNHTIVTSGDGLLQVGEIMSIEPDGYAWVEIGFGHANGRVMAAIANQLVFSELQNCTYANDTLTYTSGDLAIFGEQGYEAWGNYSDTDVNLPYDGVPYILIGNGASFDEYQGSAPKGYQVVLSNGFLVVFNDEGGIINLPDFDLSQGSLSIAIKDSQLILTNTLTAQSWTSPQSAYLANPKYMGAVVMGTEPLTIKAL